MIEYQSYKVGSWLRAWYPEAVLGGEEVFVPAWFDGSPEAIERLTAEIRAALGIEVVESCERI